MALDVAQLRPCSSLSVSTGYHSCLEDGLSDKQYQDSVYSSYSGEHDGPEIEPTPITKEHYEQLRCSLNPSENEPPNFRSDARDKLTRLTRVQFLELAMDVHDQVRLVNTSKRKNMFRSTSPDLNIKFPPHRTEARLKIAKMRPGLLRDLMSDIFHELGRRYPKFKEAGGGSGGGARSVGGSGILLADALRDRTPLSLLAVDHNFLNDDMDEIVKNVTRELNNRKFDIISQAMSVTEIILVLGQHGCPNITGMLDLSTCGTAPIAGGGFGDVYKGHLRGGIEVAIKCPRLFLDRSEIEQIDLKATARELHAWSKYNHPNVAPLLGVAVFRGRIAMISPWMNNGTLNQYIARNPTANRLGLCCTIAGGLTYLHSMGTAHGDIKALNVLVSHDGVAKLIDFGNSRLKNCTLQFTGSQSGYTISTRWTAPELLVDGGTHSLEADVYALGMTILEVMTGKIPYSEVRTDPAVITRVVIQKQLPERPDNLVPSSKERSDVLWKLLNECWSHDPKLRPRAAQVRMRLQRISRQGPPSLAELGF